MQLAGWTFFQGLDSLGGDVHWSWQSQNDAVKLAQESAMIEGGGTRVGARAMVMLRMNA